MSENPNLNLLKYLAAGLLGGAGLNAAFRTFGSQQKAFDPSRDLRTPDAETIPVTVDLTPSQAAKFEEITGQKVSLAYEKTAAADDYNWLTYLAAGGGGAALGWSLLSKIMDSIKNRKLDRRLQDAKDDLASMYTEGIGNDKLDFSTLPEQRKLGYLQNTMEGCYEMWKDNKEHFKTAGILDSIGSGVTGAVSSPIKSLGGGMLSSLYPVLALVLMYSGAKAFANRSGSAGDRDKLKALTEEIRKTKPKPNVELVPRVSAKAQATNEAPAPLDP